MNNGWQPPGGYGPPNGQPQGQPWQQPQQPPQGQPWQQPQGQPQGQPWQQQQPVPQGQPWHQHPPPQGQPHGQPMGQQPQFNPYNAPGQGPQQGGFSNYPSTQNPFQSLNDADPTVGGGFPFFTDGLYRLRIEKTELKQARKSGKLLYIIQGFIVDSTSGEANMQPGCTGAAMIDLSNQDMRDRNMKRWIASVLGSDPMDERNKGPHAPDGAPWDHHAVNSASQAQPWRGWEVGLYAHTIDTKNGSDFTVMDWLPVAMAQQRIQEVRSMQGGAPPRGTPTNVGAPMGPPAQGAPPGYQNGGGAPGHGHLPPQQGYGPPPQMPQGQPQGGYAPQGQPWQPQQPAQQNPWQGMPQGQPQGGAPPGGWNGDDIPY